MYLSIYMVTRDMKNLLRVYHSVRALVVGSVGFIHFGFVELEGLDKTEELRI